METIEISSREKVEMIEVSKEVQQVIRRSGVETGIAVVFVAHTTAAITINENADPDVVRDMLKELSKIVPYEDDYRHAEGNSAAHINSSLVGASETLIIENAQPLLGTWQGIYLCEFDGPRRRKVHVQIVSA